MCDVCAPFSVCDVCAPQNTRANERFFHLSLLVTIMSSRTPSCLALELLGVGSVSTSLCSRGTGLTDVHHGLWASGFLCVSGIGL